uniref:TPR_REGION domain-containing protein n=1 Tax=Globodera pallida TaxID=36090 RepID=A0A183CE91_GLOPA
MDQLDPLYLALLYFRINKIEEAHRECARVLDKNPLDQAAWSLKLACFAEEVFVDELENDEAGLADAYMDLGTAVATAARPGTSLPLTGTSAGGPSPAVRPRTASGRPLSGMQRPESRLKTGSQNSMEQMLRTSRTSRTSRPISASTARQARLGTASMVAQKDGGPFLNMARLNVEKYAREATVNMHLFNYVFLHEADARSALQIALIAARTADREQRDWFWPAQIAKCYYRLGMVREAEKQFSASLRACHMVETYAYLAKCYRRLDQPLSTDIGDTEQSVAYYKLLLKQEANNVEGIACLGAHFFYEGRPEIAMKFYRRILQMGVNSAELYVNLAVCCFYCQQFDLACGCLQQAHAFADQQMQADLWYNTAHFAMARCDLKMAERCLQLALASDADHAESLVNLGILKMHDHRTDEARNLFQTAAQKGPHLYEAHFNYALLLHEMGNYAQCYSSLKRSLELFPEHFYTKKLLQRVETILRS